MEGPLLAYQALLFIALCMAIYRRFETVGARDPELERRCREGLVLAIVDASHGTFGPERARDALARALPADRVVLFGVGRRPWPWYAVRVRLEIDGDRVLVRATRAARLRVGRADPPCGLRALRRALDELDGAEAWIDEALYVDLDHDARPRGGFRVRGATERPIPIDEPATAS